MSASGLSLCISISAGAVAVKAGADPPRGKGVARVWRARQESVNPEASAATAHLCKASLETGRAVMKRSLLPQMIKSASKQQ